MLQSIATPRILIVDDDDEDVFAIRRAFSKLDESIELHHLCDGAAAVEYLLDVKELRHLPDLVLLDINMPRVNGFDTLKALRSSDLTQHLPVVMLSTSDSVPEIRRAYASGANAHLVKPSSMAKLTFMAKAIVDFWMTAAALPNKD